MTLSAPLPLAGQTALVTGGARRIGAQIVRELHACGAQVAIHCHRSTGEAGALASELCALRSASSAVFTFDLLEPGALPALIEAVVARMGGLQLLINNASSFFPTPFGTVTEQDWHNLMGTNLRAPLFLSQAAAPHLRRSGGSIINLIDIHGLRALPDYMVYSTAKAALFHLTRALAREMAPLVRVNGIAPGPVLWPESGLDEEQRAEIIARTPLARVGSALDVARAVRFFAAEAPFVTGQILAVDGGRSLRW